jgi:hypothetical protein
VLHSLASSERLAQPEMGAFVLPYGYPKPRSGADGSLSEGLWWRLAWRGTEALE